MNKMPKYIYLFYIVGKIENIDFYHWLCYDKISISPDGLILQNIMGENPEEDIYFYAYTTSKKLAREFSEERNPNKIRGIKRYTEDYFSEYSEFEKFEIKFRTCKLMKESIQTRNFSKNKRNTMIEITLCITQFEKEFLNISFEGLDDRQYNAFTEMDHADIIFGCLTNKVKHCLADMGFIDYIKYIKTIYTTTSEDLPESYIDEFKIFFDYFNELFIGGDNE